MDKTKTTTIKSVELNKMAPSCDLDPFAYGNFRNFRENFIFANNDKRHNCDVKNSRLMHYLPTSVNDREISPVREVIIAACLRQFFVLRWRFFCCYSFLVS